MLHLYASESLLELYKKYINSTKNNNLFKNSPHSVSMRTSEPYSTKLHMTPLFCANFTVLWLKKNYIITQHTFNNMDT